MSTLTLTQCDPPLKNPGYAPAHISPKLKKTDLDKELLTNYRPIANIAFMSKVALQVQARLNDNQLLPSFQSAYRQYHSTETALLKVTNDILMTINSRRDAILILLELTAAFDTLDHNILIKILILVSLAQFYNGFRLILKIVVNLS